MIWIKSNGTSPDYLEDDERERNGEDEMPYRSLLTVWDGAEDARPAFDTAINLAERWSSHLDIVCVGVDRTPTGFYAAELAHEMVHDFFGQAKAEAEAHAKEARAIVDHPQAFSART